MQDLNKFLYRYKYVILFLLAFVLLYFKSSYNLKMPTVYAEDGAWLGNIMQKGFWWSAINSRSDYFVFFLALMLKFVDIIDNVIFNSDLRFVPYIICFVSYSFMALVAILPALTLGKRVGKVGKLFLYFGILLLPMGTTVTEIVGRILQFHFYMWIITFCLLVYRYDNKNKRKFMIFLTDLIILGCIATFPSVLCLVFAYALIETYDLFKEKIFIKHKQENKKKKTQESLKNRFLKMLDGEFKKYSFWQFFFFCVATFFLAVFIIIKMKSNTTTVMSEPGVYTHIIEFLVRSIAYIFVWPFYNSLNDITGLISLIAVAIFFAFGYFWISKSSRKFYLIAICSCLLITIITLTSRFGLTYFLSDYTYEVVPDRYYMVMNFTSMFPLAIIFSDTFVKKTKILKIVTSIILIYFTIIAFVCNDRIFYKDKNGMTTIFDSSFERRLQGSYDSQKTKNSKFYANQKIYIVDIDPWWTMEVPASRLEVSVRH